MIDLLFFWFLIFLELSIFLIFIFLFKLVRRITQCFTKKRVKNLCLRPLSTEEQAARRPLPVGIMLDALQDPVHVSCGKVLVAKAIKVKKAIRD